MPLLEQVEELFGTDDLYTVLGLQRDATDSQLRKAYHRMARKFHPDKAAGEKEEATKRFQAISAVHDVLSCPDRRAHYDRTGSVDDSLIGGDRPEGQGWYDYWRGRFARVDESDLTALAAEYRHSDEEYADLKAAYVAAKGDMDEVFNSVMMCNVLEDEQRYRTAIDGWIAAGDVEAFRKYTSESQRKRVARRTSAKKEAREAEALRKEIQRSTAPASTGPGRSSLEEAILARRQADGQDFLAAMEAKYAAKPSRSRKGSKKQKKRKEISEEEFQAARQQLESRKRPR